MGCCGQKRAGLTNRASVATARPSVILNARPTGFAAPSVDAGRRPQTAIASADTAGIATVALRYLASSPLRLQGNVTARAYEFSAGQPVQAVAAPDALALLASRQFRRA